MKIGIPLKLKISIPFLGLAFGLLASQPLYSQAAQEESSSVVSEDAAAVSKLRLSDSFWVSPRAEGLAGALSLFADGLDAPYYNPAGIGGLEWKSEKSGAVKNIYFPAAGGSINEHSQELNQKFSTSGGKDDSAIGQALVDAAGGTRQFGRGSFITGAIVGRFAVLPFLDAQGAAVSQGSDGLVSGHFRTNSGVVTGISLANAKNTLFLGVSRAFISSTVYKGSVYYHDIIDTSARSKALKDLKTSYSAEVQNYGILWRYPKGVRPSVSGVIRHQGGTEFVSTKSKTDMSPASYKIAEDVTLGFGISPIIDGYLLINYGLEGHHLSDKAMALDKKIATGVEFSLIDSKQKPYLSVRTGYNIAGMTYGFGAAFSMFKVELSSYAEDVGIGNIQYKERRTSGLIAIDIVE